MKTLGKSVRAEKHHKSPMCLRKYTDWLAYQDVFYSQVQEGIGARIYWSIKNFIDMNIIPDHTLNMLYYFIYEDISSFRTKT